MKKNLLISLAVFVGLIIIAGIVFFIYNQPAPKEPENINNISDYQIVSILGENADAKEYIRNNPDFKIESKEVLNIDSIKLGLSGQSFREVYYDLALEDGRYIKINLMNQAGDKGLVAVIDFKTKQAIKAYGILLIKANAN